jgi:hypothetical protein
MQSILQHQALLASIMAGAGFPPVAGPSVGMSSDGPRGGTSPPALPSASEELAMAAHLQPPAGAAAAILASMAESQPSSGTAKRKWQEGNDKAERLTAAAVAAVAGDRRGGGSGESEGGSSKRAKVPEGDERASV